MTPVLVSAYAASPAFRTWDPRLEGELLAGLCALPDVAGLEVPWLGGIHPHDDEWFLRELPVIELAVTPLPWVMGRCQKAPGYGLASNDEGGRRAALDDLRALRDDVHRLAEHSNARVSTVLLHSAPRGSGSADRLGSSLEELASWDFAGADLRIEHCDAVIAAHPFEKGFLPLDAEMEAIRASGAALGLWMNWGRSVIETRDAAEATAQIARAHASGTLRGLALSGAAAVAGPYGEAWSDAHLPFAETDPGSGSLLDRETAARALEAAGDVDRWGLKVSRRPGDVSAADVLTTVRDNLDVLRSAAASVTALARAGA
ncbi:DUF4862 family protein [Microbacterium sp. KSW2-21]|uniref:DUF4862 family protein n=1 Tax=Microbacterium algihabitans TaxID=3075992 RepID=A0ABU3RUJ6_9MICO|nr:DUF4862 family protein [Microbacterium sp. KSW2-21]MDU0326493.1 DUF4862 family protein [Microbacterium sp. KSW2-21]